MRKRQKEATGSLDMRKQNKQELRAIERRIKQIELEEVRAQAIQTRRIKAIEAETARKLRAERAAAEKVGRGFQKEKDTLLRRQAILLGRLSR